MTDPLERGPILLYDGLCGFCDGAVQFVLRRDRRGRIRFAALQGDFAAAVIARHPELAGVDSLVLVERAPGGGERVSVRSDGALRVARYLGGAWRATTLLRLVPRALRDWAYDTFARNRYRWFKRLEACRVPTAEERERFVADSNAAVTAGAEGTSL
ncbi:MAG TPA: DCC1-like thiol-disulfide oxidoreductase family protein [Gemmatimonadaceae bacterium]|nr:DCC1-like thiol-disulfide oxidoreductase family protein [Gemmatimonadaceae bacterium]